MASWLYAHQDAFSYFGGRPVRVVPDNASTATNQLFQGSGVRDVNQEYFRFGVHFGVGITPARARKPRDKAHVEKSVDIVETWVIEVLSDRVFYSLDALNQAVAIQVDMINDRRGFRGIDQSRRELFEQTDKPRLRTDHVPRWSWSIWRKSKVGVNYHIQVNKHFYSVPWRLAGQQVDVQIFDDHLDVFASGECVASHQLMPPNMQYSTAREHVPEKHQDLATKWNRERIESWAKSIGAATGELISQMFNARQVEAQAYSSTLAVLALSKQYSRTQLEYACHNILDRKDIPSVRKVLGEIRDLQHQPADTPTTQAPLSVTPTPRTKPQASQSKPHPRSRNTKSHVRGKTAFHFNEEN